jgi:hypothetical protein
VQAIGRANHKRRTERTLERAQAPPDRAVVHTHRARCHGERAGLSRTQEVAQVVPVELVTGRHAVQV